jgi:hypothetical protein
MAKLPEGDRLEARARELGVDIKGEPLTQGSAGRAPRATDYELQRRVLEAERGNRERWVWIFAMISMIASVASAITAALIAWARK